MNYRSHSLALSLALLAAPACGGATAPSLGTSPSPDASQAPETTCVTLAIPPPGTCPYSSEAPACYELWSNFHDTHCARCQDRGLACPPVNFSGVGAPPWAPGGTACRSADPDGEEGWVLWCAAE